MKIETITPPALYERIKAGTQIAFLDVRSPGEYESVHAVGARSVPLETVLNNSVSADQFVSEGEPVYVICRSGARSRKACEHLAGQGVRTVANVEGGTLAWEQAGLPVVKGAPSGSRNWIRIIGLTTVVLGFVLGWIVNPYFYWIAVGAWIALVVTGNGPCCSARGCSTVQQ